MSTAGAAGVVMLYLCATGSLTGWGWPVISGFLILSGIGQENLWHKKGNRNEKDCF
jgi:hypothetical protein